jgi:hypothetical protein
MSPQLAKPEESHPLHAVTFAGADLAWFLSRDRQGADPAWFLSRDREGAVFALLRKDLRRSGRRAATQPLLSRARPPAVWRMLTISRRRAVRRSSR